MAKEIFISYSRKDFNTVQSIKAELDRELNVDCWFDINGVESGEQFEKKIISAISSHDIFLFMLSPNSMASEYALDELSFAKRKNKRIVIVYITSCEMTDEFAFKYQKYDAIEWNTRVQHDKLIRDLRSWLSKTEQLDTRTLAEQGDANAQFDLGWCYYYGEGVEQDYAEAVKWLRKAAEQELGNAQVLLGLCYYNGEGVKQDYAEAVKWYRQAAEQGFADAQYNLGSCYYNGEGVEQDYAEAVKWYRKAAEQGDEDAIKALKNLSN